MGRPSEMWGRSNSRTDMLNIALSLCALLGPVQEPGGGWNLRERLEGILGEEFGSAMDVGPDFDGDGWPEYLVGAPDRQGWWGAVGGASLIRGGTNQPIWDFVSPYWSQIAWSTGASLSFVPDLNYDGYADVLVGDPSDREFAPDASGRVYVLDGLRGTIIREHTGEPVGTNGFDGDVTGAAIIGVPDVDGDGAGDYIVGSPRSDLGSSTNARNGKLTAYSGRTGMMLWALAGLAGDELGNSLDVGPDLTNDGKAELLAPTITTHSAGVYFVDPASGLVILVIPPILNSSNVAARFSAVTSVDLDFDGVPDLIGGSRGSSTPSALAAGMVAAVSSVTRQVLWRTESNTPWEWFGSSLSSTADLDLDGVPEILVGVPTEINNHATGKGFVQILSGRDGSRLWKIRTTTESSTLYGITVQGYGRHGRKDMALIGEPTASSVLPYAGAVHVIQFEPYLSANALSVSAAAGASVIYKLDFPASEAGLSYALLASASGRGPTIVGGISVPLTADGVFSRTLAGNYPGAMLHARGRLDAQGRAQAALIAGAGTLAAQVGRTFHLAAVTGTGASARLSSIAVPLSIEP